MALPCCCALVCVCVCARAFACPFHLISFMGFTLLSDLSIIASDHQKFSLVSLLKEILILILCDIFLVHSPPSDHDHNHHDDDHEYDIRQGSSSPSSMMVVPVLFMAESIKRQLPVMSYSIFLQKSSRTKRQQEADGNDGVIINDKDDKDCECVVCMNRIEPDDEVRVPINGCHVFHKECLDGWVHIKVSGHVTKSR